MPKHAAHATLERERTRSRIGDDVGPVPPAALEECLGVLPLADDDFEMLDIVGVSSADELGLTDADLIEVGRTAAMQAAQELAAAKEAAREEKAAAKAAAKAEAARQKKAAAEEAARQKQAAAKEKARQEEAAAKAAAAAAAKAAVARDAEAAKAAAAAVAFVRAKDAEAAAARRPVTCRVCGAPGHSMRNQDCPRYGEAPTKTRARAPGNKRAPCKYKRSAASQHREIEQQKKRRAANRKQAEIERLEGSA